MMKCSVQKKQSKKTGKEYWCLEIQITDDYTKVVFLDEAETALIKATYKNEQKGVQ